MLGAIIGDIVGSVYEWDNIKTKDFPLFRDDCFFTDDTVMTIAVADAIMHGDIVTVKSGIDTHKEIIIEKTLFTDSMKKWGRMYPDAGYGGSFRVWLSSNSKKPYNSFGNGSAMRVSPCAWVCRHSIEKAELLSADSAAVTHNHPEGIKGAVETARAEWLLLKVRKASGFPNNIDEFKDIIRKNSSYDLSKTLDEIRPDYQFNETCQDTVPQALTAFLYSTDFEDAIINAVSLGGDSDTLAAIAGGIAEAAYGIPDNILKKALTYLDKPMIEICNRWREFLREFY